MTDPTTGHDYPFTSGEGGGGAVDSVNGQTGVVVLDAENVGATPADVALPLAVPEGVVVDTTTYDDTVTGAGKLTTLVGAPGTGTVPLLAWALENDDFPRVLLLNNPNDALLYVGDGTFDPYSQAHYLAFSGGRWNLQGGLSVSGLALTGSEPGQSGVDIAFNAGTGVISASPDGTQWRLTVGDDGTVTAVDISIVVSDTFNRANVTPLGLADTGHVWSSLVGTGLSVISNQAGTASTSDHIDVIDAGVADCAVTVTYAAVLGGGDSGVVLRATDDANYLRLDDLGRLWEVVAGAPTNLGTMTNEDIGAGDVIEVTLSGTTAEVRRNGTLELTRTVAAAGTKHGLRIDGSTTPRFDAFTVKTLA